MLFLDKIEKGIIYVMGQKVHRNDEKYYLKLLEEGRRKEQMIYGYHVEEWEEQKYLNRLRRQQKNKKGKTIETYRLKNGAKINLPIYYRNQLFSEEEREMLFLDKIEKGSYIVTGKDRKSVV